MRIAPLLGLIGLNWLGLVSAAMAQTAQPNEAACSANLATQIEAITNRPEFRRSRWGILIQTVAPTPQTLYAHDADNFFIPASNVKLLTTAAALTRLGPDFRFQTTVYQISTNPQKLILQIVGQGDPSFSDQQLQSLAEQLHQQGIHQINQLIGADDSQDAINPNWESEDIQAGYGAAVNRLILNQNAIGLSLVPQALGQPLQVKWDDPAEARNWQIINRSVTVRSGMPEFVSVGRDWSQPILTVAGQLRVGSAAEPVSISVPNPAQRFLARFQQLLAAQQISVAQSLVTTDPLPGSAQKVAAVTSPPLAELLKETNQQSNNLYAEALLRALGQAESSEQLSHLEAGIKAIQSALTSLNVDPSSFRLTDGSGLSRHNLVSPEALVETLQAMARSPEATVYLNSLSTAGSSGTLQSRLSNLPPGTSFHGKTGALSGVAALSGYLERRDASRIALSILLNQAVSQDGAGSSNAQAAIDAIVLLLSGSRLCPGGS
jgi:D-alanyl-D-alanine carboxypeptidase/D-alanyl-D-alanine-endopeptidase (penicillin-binding protein 4)